MWFFRVITLCDGSLRLRLLIGIVDPVACSCVGVYRWGFAYLVVCVGVI